MHEPTQPTRQRAREPNCRACRISLPAHARVAAIAARCRCTKPQSGHAVCGCAARSRGPEIRERYVSLGSDLRQRATCCTLTRDR
eukprot:2971617-Prymnesium_polylepis.1